MLYRVFPYRDGAGPLDDGGPLHIARALQGTGRHDNPDRYGALYASRVPEAAVAERLAAFRGQEVANADLVSAGGRPYALAEVDDDRLSPLVDLDDPAQLLRRALRPSRVATRDRAVTQPEALAIFEEGAAGLAWWSTLESAWTNVTLFAERAVPLLRVGTDPTPLTLDAPVVRAAAEAVGVRLGR